MTALDVLARRTNLSVEQGDCLVWGAALPNDSIDLLFCSPSYMRARTYGRNDIARSLDDWVAWMMQFVRVFSPKVKGLIAINCEGQTEDYRYLPAPYLLVADLHRAGFNLRKPAIFDRNGIPGSGGTDWLRNDYEPIICITRPGKLPFSDNKACGHPPKYRLGGEMSNRKVDGSRVNFREAKDGTVKGAHDRDIVDIANPGNTISPSYTTAEVYALLVAAGVADEAAGSLVHCNVGGGHLGHPLAHENEAPFPVDLAAFFVKSFCPPDGVVCDPFAGSSTTGHACLENRRRYIGCDLRESQVDLSRRRLATVQPPLSFGD